MTLHSSNRMEADAGIAPADTASQKCTYAEFHFCKHLGPWPDRHGAVMVPEDADSSKASMSLRPGEVPGYRIAAELSGRIDCSADKCRAKVWSTGIPHALVVASWATPLEWYGRGAGVGVRRDLLRLAA